MNVESNMEHESGSKESVVKLLQLSRWKEGQQSQYDRSSIEEIPVLDRIFGRMVKASQTRLPNGRPLLLTQVTVSPN